MTTPVSDDALDDDGVLGDDEPHPEYYPQGRYEVQLLTEFADCTDPSDAVEHFLNDVLTYGMRGYTYRVIHENGETWLVQDGGIQSEADLLAGRVPDGTE
jgi:hypothetical protein